LSAPFESKRFESADMFDLRLVGLTAVRMAGSIVADEGTRQEAVPSLLATRLVEDCRPLIHHTIVWRFEPAGRCYHTLPAGHISLG
jgi:hypothetical protein